MALLFFVCNGDHSSLSAALVKMTTVGDAAHLRMARTGGAQGLGFEVGDIPTSEPAENKVPEDPWVDRDDVKYETKDDSAKEQYGVIRAATFERLVWFCCFSFDFGFGLIFFVSFVVFFLCLPFLFFSFFLLRWSG